MSEVKHTPGPWTISDISPNDIDGGDELLATAYPMKRDGIHESWKANANLIAAAPELCEALGEVPCVECGHPLRLHVDQYGCEFDRGDGYRMGSEYEVALGPCACHGGESDKKAIAALAKAGCP